MADLDPQIQRQNLERLLDLISDALIESNLVDVNLVYFDHDKKRLQYKMEIIHKEKKFLASTIEVLALYVDLNTRKVAEFESEKIQIMDDYIKSNLENFDNKDLKFSSKLKK